MAKYWSNNLAIWSHWWPDDWIACVIFGRFQQWKFLSDRYHDRQLWDMPNCQTNLVIVFHIPTVSFVLTFYKHNSLDTGFHILTYKEWPNTYLMPIYLSIEVISKLHHSCFSCQLHFVRWRDPWPLQVSVGVLLPSRWLELLQVGRQSGQVRLGVLRKPRSESVLPDSNLKMWFNLNSYGEIRSQRILTSKGEV